MEIGLEASCILTMNCGGYSNTYLHKLQDSRPSYHRNQSALICRKCQQSSNLRRIPDLKARRRHRFVCLDDYIDV